ncbi:nitroreductase family protein [Solibaculum mannosilyticum]|uniref:Nitroreductase n=1 Tax=Solibaculum mannosilyticum TaxID=2780922 RepID=A0A7I8CZC1_9FIRM|nr:nitroreductase family protein [Solibaculum mannosilyticum]MCO7137857.1 nitroreductase family protein [[Clostridium] leptum]BCI59837.1 nitroreductase [Solibaculum mannosilyticum]CZT56501.1 NADH dehydrogenase [Eubacteriaceae bacterium CHKCI005]
MDVMHAILERRSIRRYQNRPIEQPVLNKVLEAGRLAPSARNQQDWRFVVVKDPDLRAKMVDACCGQRFIQDAPVHLVVCANNVRDMACGQPARTVDCSIALSFMMLEAMECGLGTCWLGSFDNQAVKTLLRIPDDYQVVAVTPLGYPDEQVDARPRKALDQVVAYDDQWTD